VLYPFVVAGAVGRHRCCALTRAAAPHAVQCAMERVFPAEKHAAGAQETTGPDPCGPRHFGAGCAIAL